METTIKSRQIAVFISHVFGTLEMQMERGLLDAAEKQGFHLTFFTSIAEDSNNLVFIENDSFNLGDASIFFVPDLDNFDAVIVLMDSFSSSQRPILQRILNTRCHCPVINLRQKHSDFYNVTIDDHSAFEQIVEHLIKAHSCKDLCLMTGPRDIKIAIDRKNHFRDILHKYHLPFKEDKVFYGDFWIHSADAAIDFFTENGSKPLPDAIVCANDFMAMSVTLALSQRGFSVPKDVIVTGYDDVEDSRMNFPSITTVAPPLQEMGEAAIHLATLLIDHADPEGNVAGPVSQTANYKYITYPVSRGQEIQVPGKLISRQSCGCEPLDINQEYALRDLRAQYVTEVNYLIHATTTMITSISNAKSIQDCFSIIEARAKNETGFDDFALCLVPDWLEQRPPIDESFATSGVMMKAPVCICNGVAEPEQTFPLSQLLPDSMLQSGKNYYFFPFHFMQCFFGYVAVSIARETLSSYAIKAWLVQLENALENQRAHYQMQVLLDELESLYNRDMLTGLYNRRGYEAYAKKYYDYCLKNHVPLMIMEIDMDSLKYVNDNYGHSDGDLCIKMIADAMQRAAHFGEILVRSGGDEFIILAKDYSDAKLHTFLSDFRTALEEENNRNQMYTGASYYTEVSIGYYMEVPSDLSAAPQQELERFFRFADDRMYDEKKSHKKGR